jgi:hypothetical protein
MNWSFFPSDAARGRGRKPAAVTPKTSTQSSEPLIGDKRFRVQIIVRTLGTMNVADFAIGDTIRVFLIQWMGRASLAAKKDIVLIRGKVPPASESNHEKATTENFSGSRKTDSHVTRESVANDSVLFAAIHTLSVHSRAFRITIFILTAGSFRPTQEKHLRIGHDVLQIRTF